MKRINYPAMKQYFYLLNILMLTVFGAKAQDIHFSQYYAMPLTLNPALTGKFDGFYRVNAIYRGQYYGVTQNNSIFRTPGVSVDFSLLKEKMKGNALGVGLAFVNDQQTSTGKLNTNTIYLSLAYTLNLGKKKATQISLGFTPSYTLRNVSGDYKFYDGFDKTTLEYTNTSGFESITIPKVNYFNLAAGLFFNTQPIKWMTFYAGYSMMNILRPNVAVINKGNSDARLNFRHVAHAGFEFDLTKKWVLIPGFLYQNVAKANEANVGLMVGYNFMNKPRNDGSGRSDKGTIFLGLWNRMGADAVSAFAYRNLTPKIGLDYKNFRFGFAYDIDLGKFGSDAKAGNFKRPQAYEITLSYMGFLPQYRENRFLFNPRF